MLDIKEMKKLEWQFNGEFEECLRNANKQEMLELAEKMNKGDFAVIIPNLDEKLKDDKEVAIALLKKVPWDFMYLDKKLRNDPDVIEAAIDYQDGFNLAFTRADIRQNENWVLRGVKNRILDFRENLKRGYYCCRDNGMVIPESELSDEDILLHMIGLGLFNHFNSRDGHYIEAGVEGLFENRNYMLKALRIYPNLIKYVDSSIADKEFLIEATENNRQVLGYIREAPSFHNIWNEYLNKTDMEFYNNLKRAYEDSTERESKRQKKIIEKFIDDSQQKNTEVVLFIPNSDSTSPLVGIVRHSENNYDEVIDEIYLRTFQKYKSKMPEIDKCCDFEPSHDWRTDVLKLGLINNGIRPLNVEERLLLGDDVSDIDLEYAFLKLKGIKERLSLGDDVSDIDSEYELLKNRLNHPIVFKGGAEEEIDDYISEGDYISEIKNTVGAITMEDYNAIISEIKNTINNKTKQKSK